MPFLRPRRLLLVGLLYLASRISTATAAGNQSAAACLELAYTFRNNTIFPSQSPYVSLATDNW